jgi:hypothetical protein
MSAILSTGERHETPALPAAGPVSRLRIGADAGA